MAGTPAGPCFSTRLQLGQEQEGEAAPPITQASAKTVATTYEVLAGRRCRVCRIWPIDWRSSLAARLRRRASSSEAGLVEQLLLDGGGAGVAALRRPASRGWRGRLSMAGSVRLEG